MLFHSTVQAQLYSAPWVQPQAYNGPDDFDCIVDVLLERYLNNPLVKEFCWIYYYWYLYMAKLHGFPVLYRALQV